MGHQHSQESSPEPKPHNAIDPFKHMQIDPVEHKDSFAAHTPISPLSTVVSRPEYSTSKLQRFSSCPPANNTMSLIIPPSQTKSDTLCVFTPTLTATKSSSSLPRTNTPKSTTNAPRRRRSSLLIVNNGVTGKYISSRICKIAAKFWHDNIESLSMNDQLEIGCAIFFSMLSSNAEMKKMMKRKFKKNIENTSLKYLDMMGWLIRYLITDNVDLYALLIRLGAMHCQMGIGIQHFPPMLAATHETLGYYFETKYSIEVKYAMDEIFSLAAQLMTGQPLQRSAHLMDLTRQFSGDEIPFLRNLDLCLQSSVGREYLYRYLAQTWCDEIVIFMKSLRRFKRGLSAKERFMIAREITKVSIEPAATFSLNLSYDTRKNALYQMSKLDVLFMAKQEFKVGTDFFDEVEKEIIKLIMDNHWRKFVDGIESLHSKSNFVVD